MHASAGRGGDVAPGTSAGVVPVPAVSTSLSHPLTVEEDKWKEEVERWEKERICTSEWLRWMSGPLKWGGGGE